MKQPPIQVCKPGFAWGYKPANELFQSVGLGARNSARMQNFMQREAHMLAVIERNAN